MEGKIAQRITSKVMHGYWELLEMPGKMKTALQWAMSSGIVFAHVYWDKTIGPMIQATLKEWLSQAAYIVDPAKQQEFVQERMVAFGAAFGQEALQAGTYSGPSGDPVVDIAPVMEVSWWPREPINKAGVRYWMRTTKKTVGEMAEFLGVTHDEVRKLSMGGTYSNLPGGTGGIMGGNNRWRQLHFFGSLAHTGYSSEEQVLVHTLYRVPSPSMPSGGQAVVLDYAADTIDPPMKIQNPLSIVPLLPLVEKPIRGKLYGTCLVDQLFDAQGEINVAASQAADYRSTRVAPTLVNYTANPQQPGALSSRPGSIFMAADPQHKPGFIEMPQVPPDYFLTVEQNRRWMSNISGTTTIDVGVGEGTNTRSGRALKHMTAQNDLRLIPFAEDLDPWVSMIGSLVHSLLQERAVTQRIVDVVGDDNQVELVKFRGKDLEFGSPTGAGSGASRAMIRTKAFSTIPKDPGEMMQFVQTALTPDATGRSLLDPEKDRNQILDLLGMGNIRKVFDRDRLDTIRAASEIDLWESGKQAPPPRKEDNDQVHIESMIQWKKGDGYAVSAGNNPILGELVNAHLEAHKVSLVRKQIEPLYLAIKAHVSEWMETRAELLESLSQVPPGSDEKQAKEAGKFAQMLVNLLLPLPLIGMEMLAAQQEGQKPGGQGAGGGKKQSGGTGKPKKKTQSANQGVSKEEQRTG
jgi:hypothetical protein